MRPFGEQKTKQRGMKPRYLNNFFDSFLSKIFIQKKQPRITANLLQELESYKKIKYSNKLVFILLIVFFLSCSQCILHQRTDCHGADTTWNRCDIAAFRCDLLKVYITVEPETAFSCCVWDSCRTYIYNDGTAFNHIGRYKIWTANRRYDDIGFTTLFLQIGRMAVTNGYRGVTILLLHHQLGHGFANNIASSQNDALLS